MTVFIKLVLIFFIGAMCGWVMELFFRRFAHKKWVNPGFLAGPWLPLYGLGLLGLYGMSVIDLSFIGNPVWEKVVLILGITVVMTLLEYVTGLIFIKGLKVKLWDYSDRLGNIQGIICPLFTLIWGAIGALYNLLLHEHVCVAVNYISGHLEYSYILGILSGIFIMDNVYSFNVVARIKKWATEHDIVVKYEQLRLGIAKRAEKAKQKTNFIFSLNGPKGVIEELNKYFSEQGKKFAEERNRKAKGNDSDSVTDASENE